MDPLTEYLIAESKKKRIKKDQIKQIFFSVTMTLT